MRKVILFLLFILCITGCLYEKEISSNKIVVCIKEISDYEGSISNKFSFYIEDDKVIKVNMVETYSFYDDYEDMIDMVMEMSNSFNDVDGYYTKLEKIDNKSYKMIQEIDYKILNIDDIYELIDSNEEIDEKFIKDKSLDEAMEVFHVEHDFICTEE